MFMLWGNFDVKRDVGLSFGLKAVFLCFFQFFSYDIIDLHLGGNYSCGISTMS